MTILDLYRLLHIEVINGRGHFKVALDVEDRDTLLSAPCTSVTRDEPYEELTLSGYDEHLGVDIVR